MEKCYYTPNNSNVPVKPFDKVIVRNSNTDTWIATHYGYVTLDECNGALHVCMNGMHYKQCLLYNDKSKHLLGTNDDYNNTPHEPKEYHVWTQGQFNEWFTKTEFENFIKTAVINNKDIKDFHVLYVKCND